MRRKPTNFSSEVTRVVPQKGRACDEPQNTFTSTINTLKHSADSKKLLHLLQPLPILSSTSPGASPLPGQSGWDSASAEAHQLFETKAKNIRCKHNCSPAKHLHPRCRSPGCSVAALACQQLQVLADKWGRAVHCAGISHLCAHCCTRPHEIQIRLPAHRRVKWCHVTDLVNPLFGMLQGPLPQRDLSAHQNYKGDTVHWTQAGLLITVTHSWDSSAASTPSQRWKDGESTAFKYAWVNEWEHLYQNFQHTNVFKEELFDMDAFYPEHQYLHFAGRICPDLAMKFPKHFRPPPLCFQAQDLSSCALFLCLIYQERSQVTGWYVPPSWFWSTLQVILAHNIGDHWLEHGSKDIPGGLRK